MATIVLYPFGQGLPIGGPSYIMAWNGLSVPVEEEIPAGVVVTYDSVNYTGTLAASTSTKGKMFLVASSNSPETKDIYVTVSSNNGTYSWMKVGDTDIDISGYATETWVEARDVDLTVAEYEALVANDEVDPDKRYFVDED